MSKHTHTHTHYLSGVKQCSFSDSYAYSATRFFKFVNVLVPVVGTFELQSRKAQSDCKQLLVERHVQFNDNPPLPVRASISTLRPSLELSNETHDENGLEILKHPRCMWI